MQKQNKTNRLFDTRRIKITDVSNSYFFSRFLTTIIEQYQNKTNEIF